MVDLDELDQLCNAAQISRGPTPSRLRTLSVTVQEREALLALRNSAEELIRDARRWREHEAVMRRAIDTEYQEPK
jgi:hypothetical protein